MVGLDRVMAYRQPFRARVARDGLLAGVPVSVAYAALTLVVSAAWRAPSPVHQLAAACCAWRAADLPHTDPLPLLGSAFLVMRPAEAVWTVAAIWLVFGPLEATVGSLWLVAIGVVGHVVSTVLIDLCWLAGARDRSGLAGLDVGTSAVVVTAAAALAVSTRSVPVAVVLAACLAIDIVVAPDLATAEHLIAVAIGIGAALLHRSRRPPPSEREPLHAAPGEQPTMVGGRRSL